VHRIGQHILEDRLLWALAIGSGAATLVGVSFWLVLGASGLTYAAARLGRRGVAVAVLTLCTAAAVAIREVESGVGWPGEPASGEAQAVGVLATAKHFPGHGETVYFDM
jgi:chromate transporter